MLPASDRDALTALRRIRINGGEAVLTDPAAGLTWTLLEPRIDLRRAAGGGLAGEGEALLRAGAVSVPVRLSGEARGTPMRVSVGLLLPALRPAELASIWPPLAPLAVLDAPVTLSARAEFDADARPDRMQARLEAGPGALVLAPGQRLPLAGLAATVEGSSRALTIREAVLRLPGQAGRPGPSLTAKGEVLQRDGAWRATLDLGTDAVPGQHAAEPLAGGPGAGGPRPGAAQPALRPGAGGAGAARARGRAGAGRGDPGRRPARARPGPGGLRPRPGPPGRGWRRRSWPPATPPACCGWTGCCCGRPPPRPARAVGGAPAADPGGGRRGPAGAAGGEPAGSCRPG